MMPENPAKPTKAALRRSGPGDEERFLSRWSARKEAVRAGEELVEPEDDNLPAEVENEPEESAPDEVDLESLPDIETLTGESDFSLFMQKGVPDALRNKALRKLWLTDPVLANVDGLVDYGEDFTGDGLAGKAFKTAWKLGQGFLTDDDVADQRRTPSELAAAEEQAAAEELAAAEEQAELAAASGETDRAEGPGDGAPEAEAASSPENDRDVTAES